VRPGVDALCRHLGIGPRVLSRFTAGSRPVYAAGELVLKLYPQADGDSWSVEAGVLAAVEGALPVAAPRVHATGSWDGWSYLLMSRLPGIPLDVAWPEFAARQRAACEQSQRGLGLAEEWASQIPGFLASITFPDEEPVLLHTEVMRQHLLAEPGPWRLSGLIDFEPAMRGAREYEFACAGAFFSQGDAVLLREVLTSYGHHLDDELPRRLLAWLLLHRYSSLPWYLDRLPRPAEPTLDALANRWFGC
jgi:hygromycin-B 7''-O-kinase